MDTQLVVAEALDEGERLWREFDKSTSVKAAYWLLREGDFTQWSLNIASDQINDTNKAQAYLNVSRLIHDLPLPHLIYASIRLVPGTDRVVRDVINVRMHFPGDMPLRCPVSYLGGIEVREAYLYALPDSTPRTAESVTVFSQEAQAIVDRLASRNIKVSVHRLGEQYYSCRVRINGDQRDSQVTYAESVLEGLQRISILSDQAWPDLIPASSP